MADTHREGTEATHAAIMAASHDLARAIDDVPGLGRMVGERVAQLEQLCHDYVDEHVPPHDNPAIVGSRAHREAYPDHAAYRAGAPAIEWQWDEEPVQPEASP